MLTVVNRLEITENSFSYCRLHSFKTVFPPTKTVLARFKRRESDLSQPLALGERSARTAACCDWPCEGRGALPLATGRQLPPQVAGSLVASHQSPRTKKPQPNHEGNRAPAGRTVRKPDRSQGEEGLDEF